MPAHLVRAAPDDFEYAEASSDCEDSSATMPLVSFRLHVSDPNKDDRLIAHVFVNGDYIGSSSERIEPNGKVEREDLVMCVELGRLNTAPCNLVEILVSREFDERFPDQPEEPGDLSSERWWMFAASDTWPEATPEDCAKQERAMEDE